jgi:hypothetical protein
VNIPGYFLEILIGIHQKRFIAPLVKMAPPAMLPVIIRGIRNIEMTHEFLKVSKRGFDEQMEVV